MPSTPTATVELNLKGWHLHCKRLGLDSDAKIAAALRVDRSTVHRVTTRKTNPSMTFVAAAWLLFKPQRLEEIFLPVIIRPAR